MKSKSTKKLRRLAERMTVGKSKQQTKKVYKRLKSVHKANQGEI